MLDMVSQTLVNGVGGVGWTYFAARVATGMFFVISGYHKLTNDERHAALVLTLRNCNIPFVSVMQWFVPSVELLAGLGIAFGFLTPLASFGLAVICLVAICTDGVRRVKAAGAVSAADQIDEILYLPEVLYIVLLALFVAGGGGPISVDAVLSRILWGRDLYALW